MSQRDTTQVKCEILQIAEILTGISINLRILIIVILRVSLRVDGPLLDGQLLNFRIIIHRSIAVTRCLSHRREPVERWRFRSFNQAIQGLDRLQLDHDLVEKTLGTGASQIECDAFSIAEQLIRCKTGDDDEITKDDFEIVGPTSSQYPPELFDFTTVRVGILSIQCVWEERVERDSVSYINSINSIDFNQIKTKAQSYLGGDVKQVVQNHFCCFCRAAAIATTLRT